MEFRSEEGNPGFPLSTKDTILLILFGFSGLLCFALSFTVLQSDGRPYLFTGCALLCAVCLVFAEKKKEIILSTIAFILLRAFWSLMVEVLHHS